MWLIFLNNTHMLLSFIHVDIKVCEDSASLPSTPSCNIFTSKFYNNSELHFHYPGVEISFIAKPSSMIIFSVNIVTVTTVFWVQFSVALGYFFVKQTVPSFCEADDQSLLGFVVDRPLQDQHPFLTTHISRLIPSGFLIEQQKYEVPQWSKIHKEAGREKNVNKGKRHSWAHNCLERVFWDL